jgi:Ca2+ transporting ATPase
VGIATAWGFIWWFLWYEHGPRVSWADLTSFQRCTYTTAKASGYSCDVFSDKHPKTISMSVLVMIEMFNALNNLSENGSLLRVPPWDNLWLLGAIAVSVALHCMIVYVPWFEGLFSVIHLSWGEWRMVLLLSAPVILIDEVLKYISRQRLLRGGGGVNGRPRYSGGSAAPLRSITIDSSQDKMS